MLLLCSIFFYACGSQKRLAAVRATADRSKAALATDAAVLDAIRRARVQKGLIGDVDSSVGSQVDALLDRLKSDLDALGETVAAVAFFAEKKAGFTRSGKRRQFNALINRLDSFNLHQEKRDRIYDLLNEAVTVLAVAQYNQGAFFDPGVYQIKSSGFETIRQSFLPAIDSMAALSNRYADVNRKIHLVIVGYADATPIDVHSPLYQGLKTYLNMTDPTRAQLNIALSDLRAAELLSNLERVLQSNAHRFNNYDQLKISSACYGRGEALPFKNITDYRDSDERRRVVVFYWAILPEW